MTPAHDGVVRLAGARLRYSRHAGDGSAPAGRPPVLLLHPWFGCRQMWEPLADRLDVPSYAVDWYSLAEGGAPHEWSAWASPAGLARAALALLDEEGLDRVDVVGNSVGGIVAQLIAADAAQRVRRLVLIGTGASLDGPPTPFGLLVSRWLEQPAWRPSLTGRLVDALVTRPPAAADRARWVGEVLGAEPGFVAAVLTAARASDLRPRLASITAPTLVLRGEHDTARTAAHVRELVAGIAGAEAVELAGCGHSPMVEDPDLVAALVREHLGD